MVKSRFVRKWKSSGQYIFDNKTEEYFHNIIADNTTLAEVCRLLNALDTKNKLANERIENQCEIIRELKQELKKHE